MTKENTIVPVILTDNVNSQPSSTSVQKPKLACQLKIGHADLRVYNGASQYILRTILKELVHAN